MGRGVIKGFLSFVIFSISPSFAEEPKPSAIFYIRRVFPDDPPEDQVRRRDLPVSVVYDDDGIHSFIIPNIAHAKGAPSIIPFEKLRDGYWIEERGVKILRIQTIDFDPKSGGELRLTYLRKYRLVGVSSMATSSFKLRAASINGQKIFKPLQFNPENQPEFSIVTLFFSVLHLPGMTIANGISAMKFSNDAPRL
jgi:hypothetical protein